MNKVIAHCINHPWQHLRAAGAVEEHGGLAVHGLCKRREPGAPRQHRTWSWKLLLSGVPNHEYRAYDTISTCCDKCHSAMLSHLLHSFGTIHGKECDMTTQTVSLVATDTINDIIEKQPEALRVFHQFGLDACCGGTLPLAVAAERHGLNLQEVLQALSSLQTGERNQ